MAAPDLPPCALPVLEKRLRRLEALCGFAEEVAELVLIIRSEAKMGSPRAGIETVVSLFDLFFRAPLIIGTVNMVEHSDSSCLHLIRKAGGVARGLLPTPDAGPWGH